MNAFLKKIVEWGIYCLVFFLPWQTVWIARQGIIGTGAMAGVWQYGTIRFYALEVLIWILVILSCVRVFQYIRTHRIREMMRAWYRSRMFLLDSSIGLFVLLSGVSIFWSLDGGVAFRAFLTIIEAASLIVIFRSADLKLSRFACAWVAAASIQGILAFWQFGIQNIPANTMLGIASHDPTTLGTAVIQAGDRRWLRSYGAFPHPNVLGAYLAVSMVWCMIALSHARKKWHWLILVAASQIILGGLLLSFSRGAWLALSVTVIVVFFCLAAVPSRYRDTLKRSKGQRLGNTVAQRNIGIPHVHPIAVMVLVSILTIGIFASFFIEEITARFGFAESRLETMSINERFSSFERALPLIKERWLTGTGIGNFTNTLYVTEREHARDTEWYTYQPIHNALIMVGAELGISGVVLAIIITFLLILRIPRPGHPLIVILIILSLFDHFLWTTPVALYMASSVAGFFMREETGKGS